MLPERFKAQCADIPSPRCTANPAAKGLMGGLGRRRHREGPTADEVAERVKGFCEGNVAAHELFDAHRPDYREPFFRVSDLDVLALLSATFWLFVASVEYNVLSAFRMSDGVFVVEAEVTYHWRTPFGLLASSSAPVHYYNTVRIRPRGGSWRCVSLETVRESYTLSVPARLLTTPFIQLLSAAMKAVRLVAM